MIEYYSNGQWSELLGHGCETMEQARNYVETLNSKYIRVVGDNTPDPTPEPKLPSHKLSEKSRNLIISALRRF